MVAHAVVRRVGGRSELYSIRKKLQPFTRICGTEFAEAVLSLTAKRHEGMLGIDHGLNDSGVTALACNGRKRSAGRDGISSRFLGDAIISLAYNFGHRPIFT